MRTVFAIAAVLTGVSALGGPAWAQHGADGWEFSLTPRLWYLIANTNSFSDSNVVQRTVTSAEIPMVGGSLRVKPPGFDSTDFLLTAFYGSTDVEGKAVFAAGGSANSRTDVRRADVEFLVRNRVPDSNVSWFYGARWVLLLEDATIDSGFAFSASGTSRLEEETHFVFGEVGISFTAPIDRAGRHALFGNLIGGVGHQSRRVQNRASAADPNDNGIFPVVDTNVGYEYRVSSLMSAHLRYRTFIFLEDVRDEILVLHGPEIGFTLRF